MAFQAVKKQNKCHHKKIDDSVIVDTEALTNYHDSSVKRLLSIWNGSFNNEKPFLELVSYPLSLKRGLPICWDHSFGLLAGLGMEALWCCNIIGIKYVREWCLLRYVWLPDAYSMNDEHLHFSFWSPHESTCEDMIKLLRNMEAHACIAKSICDIESLEAIEYKSIRSVRSDVCSQKEVHDVPCYITGSQGTKGHNLCKNYIFSYQLEISKCWELHALNFRSSSITLDTPSMEMTAGIYSVQPEAFNIVRSAVNFPHPQEMITDWMKQQQYAVALICKCIGCCLLPDVYMETADVCIDIIARTAAEKFGLSMNEKQRRTLRRIIYCVSIMHAVNAVSRRFSSELSPKKLSSFIKKVGPELYASKVSIFFSLSLFVYDWIQNPYVKLLELLLLKDGIRVYGDMNEMQYSTIPWDGHRKYIRVSGCRTEIEDYLRKIIDAFTMQRIMSTLISGGTIKFSDDATFISYSAVVPHLKADDIITSCVAACSHAGCDPQLLTVVSKNCGFSSIRMEANPKNPKIGNIKKDLDIYAATEQEARCGHYYVI